MDLKAMIKDLQENTALFVALYTALLALLSIFLSVQEYYRRKAYYDYFGVEDRFRPGMRSGFHPQYLTFAVLNIVIVTLAAVILFGVLDIQNKGGLIHLAVFGGIAAVWAVSYAICWVIYLMGQRSRIPDKDWAEVRRDYGAASTLYGRLKSAQWTIAAAIVFLSYYPTKWLSWVFAPTLLVWAVLVFYLGEYFIVQKMIPHHVRQFMAWKNGERMYILLCSDKLYYCVRAEQKEDRLDIFPDDVLLLEREEADRSFHRIRFTDFQVIQR